MIITAKFASACPCCSQRIVVGSQVEWTKGSPARHVSCAPVAAPRRGTWTGCSCGSVTEFSKRSDCAHCQFDA